MRVNLDSADQGATISAEEMKIHLQSLLKARRRAAPRSPRTAAAALSARVAMHSARDAKAGARVQGHRVAEWVKHAVGLPQYVQTFRDNSVTVRCVHTHAARRCRTAPDAAGDGPCARLPAGAGLSDAGERRRRDAGEGPGGARARPWQGAALSGGARRCVCRPA
jgi:hypothetical protein